MQGNNNEQATKNIANKNYLKPLKKNEDDLPKTQMKDKEDLHAMLHKLKNYYNELNKLKNSKVTELNHQKDKFNNLNKQIEDKIAFSDIEFPNERITIEDYEKFKDSKETKDTIRIKIENLILDKNQLLQKYENEIEYGNKINNLIKIEKRNHNDTYEHILQTQEKLNTLKAAQRNLEINKEEKQKKEKIFSIVKKELNSEIIKLDDVIEYQTKNYFNIVGELKAKNEVNQQKKKEIEMKDTNLDLQHKKSSEKIISEIQKTKLIQYQNTEKESYIIKLILGLDIIKRYFIDVVKQGKEINTAELMKSEDYKTFRSEKFIIRENNYESTNSNNYSNNTNNNFFNSNNVNNCLNNNINNNNFNSNSNNNFNSSENNFKSNPNNNTTHEDEKHPGRTRISLKSLKEKLDNLDLDYEKIYDFYTKIINKTNFFHSHMINFNLKQISLEGKKEQYTECVSKIIAKNSKNIEDLRKYDAKFNYLFRNFENQIKSSNLYENLKSKVKDFDSNPSQHVDFYKKCGKYLSDLKTFNEFLLFNFKRIKIACGDEALKSALKAYYKLMKTNIKNDKNSNEIEKMEYIKDFFKSIELEYLKENKKLEKILRAIDEYPGTKSQSGIKTENSNFNVNVVSINNNYVNESKNNISNMNNDVENKSLNSGKINNYNNNNSEIASQYSKNSAYSKILESDKAGNNKEEECMENSHTLIDHLEKDEATITPELNKNASLELIFDTNKGNRISRNNMNNILTSKNNILEDKLSPMKSNIKSPNSIENSKNIKNISTSNINNLISNYNEILTKKGSIISNSENLKSEFSSNFNHPVDIVGGFPYISPYSGWSITKLEEEREISIKRINELKSQINLGKIFEDRFNLNNLIILDVPFEKTLFYFFENTEKIVETIKHAKDTTDVCATASIDENKKPLDEAIRNKVVAVSPESKINYFYSWKKNYFLQKHIILKKFLKSFFI
jgi:hypothetical protein